MGTYQLHYVKNKVIFSRLNEETPISVHTVAAVALGAFELSKPTIVFLSKIQLDAWSLVTAEWHPYLDSCPVVDKGGFQQGVQQHQVPVPLLQDAECQSYDVDLKELRC